MCIRVTEKDVVAQEDIIAFKLVRVVGRDKFFSQYEPSERWDERYPNTALGTFEEYVIGEKKTDKRGEGYYLFECCEDARWRARHFEVTRVHLSVLKTLIPKGAFITTGLTIPPYTPVDQRVILARTIIPLEVVGIRYSMEEI